MAAAESRTISELFRQAFRVYRVEKIRASLAEFQAEAKRLGHNGHGPEDVERLVDEVRAEIWAEKHGLPRASIPRPIGNNYK